MLLSYNELVELTQQSVITDVDLKDINAASIDVHLGDELLIERSSEIAFSSPIDLAKREAVPMVKLNIRGTYYDLSPGEFVLGATREKFNLPNTIVAEFYLKSSHARCGLEHLHAGHCDPGWNGSALTLELKNMLRHHRLRLSAGQPIGQILLYRVQEVPQERSYATIGRYNGDSSVQGIKE